MAVVVTEPAATEIRKIIEEKKLESSTVLRMGMAGGGCSGLQYSLAFDTEFNPEVDAKFDNFGVSLVTRKKYALHLDGTVIDFQNGPMGAGFSIENPNYAKGGGCAGCGGH